MEIIGEYGGIVGGGDLTVRPEDIARRKELQLEEALRSARTSFIPDISGFDISSIDIPTPTLPDIALPDISLPSKEDILTPIAETAFDVLDPFYGEGGVLEPVTEKVQEGDLIGAGLTATDVVFVDPVIEYGQEKLEPVTEGIQENKDLLLLGAGVLALLLLRK